MFLPAFNISSLSKSPRNFVDEFEGEWIYSFISYRTPQVTQIQLKSLYVPVISAGGLEDSLLLVLLLGDLPTTTEGFESKVRGQKVLNKKLKYEKKSPQFFRSQRERPSIVSKQLYMHT